MDHPQFLTALTFAAHKHRDQRRKDARKTPYINHPIEVAETLWRVGQVRDPVIILGALLHDTIEDTETTAEELSAQFGEEVSQLVQSVSDDYRLPKAERKRLQIETAPKKDLRAKQLRIADKICNIRDLGENPPENWPLERQQAYLDWSLAVVAGCRGSNEALERHYDEVAGQVQQQLNDRKG